MRRLSIIFEKPISRKRKWVLKRFICCFFLPPRAVKCELQTRTTVQTLITSNVERQTANQTHSILDFQSYLLLKANRTANQTHSKFERRTATEGAVKLKIQENMKAIEVIPLLTPSVMEKIEAIVQTKPKRPDSYR